MLTREQILQADDLPRKEVQIPEWGGSVFVRMLTGAERERFEADHSAIKDPTKKNMRARLAAMTICDESGTPLFTVADIVALSAKASAGLDRVWEVAGKLNRIIPEEYEALGKGSRSTPSDSSPSNSPPPSEDSMSM